MENAGTVIARVYTSRAQLPVENASVSISLENSDGSLSLLGLRISNESGLTAPVSVVTPPAADGTAPNGSTPFTQVQMRAAHPLFERIVVKNVEVYPGVKTIQEFEMIPLPEFAGADFPSEEYVITPPNL